MRILIIGAEGQVGGFLIQTLAPRHAVSGADMSGKQYPVLDIRDPQQVAAALHQAQPEYVILAAAMTHVDKCEEFPQASEAVNVRGPENVARACQQAHAGLAFFSTDYIFDGRSGPYVETDRPNPLSIYGRHKWEAEKIIAARVPQHLIVRTMNVYSYLPGSVNFFMQLYDRARKGEPITVASDQMINPTQAVNLAQALGELIDQQATGIFNLAGTTRLGRDEFARQVVAKLGYDPARVKSLTTAEFKQKAARPLNSGLIVTKAQARLQTNKLWDLNQALDYTLNQISSLRDASE